MASSVSEPESHDLQEYISELEERRDQAADLTETEDSDPRRWAARGAKTELDSVIEELKEIVSENE